MLFPSNVFLFCFLPVILVLYYVLGGLKTTGINRIWKNLVLFVGSIVFYAYGEKWYCLLLLISILWNWLMGLCIDYFEDEKKRKLSVAVMAAVNIGMLFVYKYLDFAIVNINRFMNTEWEPVGLSLPIGISFFTFQSVSYCVDVYRKKAKVQKNPFYVGLYIALFPQLIAGPIVRYESIALQIESRTETKEEFAEGVERFLVGICKKVLLADVMAIFAERIFGMVVKGNSIATSMAWLGAIAFTLQIYFDFSAYSDMAIGLGKMFGFTFEENFNYPYVAKSVTEFWRRWHISLSTWFRDYVYIPLGGNRQGKIKTYLNLFLVWLLTGVWHGAGWTFILWGLWYFVFLVLEKSLFPLGEKIIRGKKILAFFGHVYTMLVVIVGWTLFKAPSLPVAVSYLSKMFGIGVTEGICETTLFYLKDNWIFFLCALVFAVPVSEKIKKYGSLYRGSLALLFLISLVYIVKGSYSPFIYFNF